MVSVAKSEWKSPSAGKKEKPIKGVNVVLEDTVLFPEGGGQVTAKNAGDVIGVTRIQIYTEQRPRHIAIP